MTTRRWKLAAAVTAAALVALVVWVWQARPHQRPSPPRAAAPGRTPAPPSSPRPGDLTRDASPRAPRPSGSRRLDAASRARLASEIATARARREAAPSPRVASDPGAPPTRFDLLDRTGATSGWEKRQLGVLNELLGECYDLARADAPGLAGKVALLYTISGEPDLGGLVSEIRFDEAGTTIAHEGMRECMRESLHALELEPPPAGVEASRQVTLVLEPDP